MKRARLIVKGEVQRVGYWDEVLRLARKLHVTGFVENHKPYDMLIVAEGEDERLEHEIGEIKARLGMGEPKILIVVVRFCVFLILSPLCIGSQPTTLRALPHLCKNGERTCMSMRTITWDDERTVVKLIDQTLLPAEYRLVECARVEELIEAIQQLKVRGAPALGAAGAFGVALACLSARTDAELQQKIEQLKTARPTAVNLSYGVTRAVRTAQRGKSMPERASFALEEAKRIADEDIAINKQLGAHGSALLEDGDVVLTHCNAGRLACVDWGTALGVIRSAVEHGKRIEVIASETRPLNQGSRLTAWELLEDHIPVTLITDSMGAAVMRAGKVTKVLVGADRVVKEGVVNKIGTYMHAVVAKAHGVPFYVAAPLSSFDLDRSYAEVEIEERNREELLYCGSKQLAPLTVKVYNPAFDFTPFELITAVITEKGVLRPQELPALQTTNPGVSHSIRS